MTDQSLEATIAELVKDAKRLKEEFAYYWSPEGENIAQLEIFIDPDLFQYIKRLYDDAQAFLERVVALEEQLK